MKQWILSIVGMVVISLVAEIILSESEINSFVKKIFGIVTILIILAPVKNIINFDLNSIFDFEYKIDDKYIDTVENEQENFMSKVIEKLLENNGFYNVKAKIKYNLSNYENTIESVELNLHKLVIKENQVHINKYSEIKSIVCNALGIKENIIIFDE